MNKIKTIQYQGREYAQVKDRLKEFREANPQSLIETFPTVSESSIMVKARIVKDKGNPASGEATGHSYIEIAAGTKKEKLLEKQETIAVGRALALLGYAADGEIASAEEMEEFIEYQNQKKQSALEEAKDSINAAKSLDELKAVWVALPPELKKNKELVTLTNNRKKEYEGA